MWKPASASTEARYRFEEHANFAARNFTHPGGLYFGGPMPKAYWKGAVIAESDDTLLVDGRHYFPLEHVREDCLRPSQTRAANPERGEARYFHVVVGRELNADAAWTYPDPAAAFHELKGRIAFWHGVEVE